MDKRERGKCYMCQTEYPQYEPRALIFGGFGRQYSPCPKCNYNPEIKDKIREIISKDYEFVIINGKLKITNSGWMTDLIEDKIKQYWQKSMEMKR